MERFFIPINFPRPYKRPLPALVLFGLYLLTLGCAALTPVPHQALSLQDCYTLAWGPEDYQEIKKTYQKNLEFYKAPYETFLAAYLKTELGFSYLRLYKAPEAEAAFKESLWIYPAFARAQMGLAVLQLKLNHNPALARGMLEKALLPPFEAAPEVRAFGHNYLAIIENLSADKSEPEAKGAERASAHLKEAVRLAPQNLTPYIYWGEMLWNRGQYQKAVEVYTQAVKRVPKADDPQYENWGWLSLRRAQALYKSGRYQEAKDKLKSLAKTVSNKKQVPPHLWQAMAQEMVKNLELNREKTEVMMLSVPHSQQQDSFCVPAATASIFEYYGDACSQEEVAQGAGTAVELDNGGSGKWGTLRKDIINYARGRGFSAYNFCGTLALAKEMVKKGFPLIASLRYPSGAAHVLVIIGYDDRLGAFIVNDPATLREDYYPYGYFSLLWGAAFNNSLLLVPQAKAKEVEEFRRGMIYCSTKDTINEGDAYQSEGQEQKARQAYLAALMEDARNIEALYKLALADIRGQDYTAAKKSLEKAQEVVSEEGKCWEVLWGDCEVNPLRSQLDLAMAFVLGRLGQKEAGEKHFQRALSQNPYNMEVWYQRALAGEEDAFLMLMEYQPQKAQNHLLWGKSLAQQGKIKEAQKEFRQALRRNPQSAEAYYYLGLMEGKDRDDRAAEDCYTCASVYSKDKRLKEAVEKEQQKIKHQ